MEQGTGEAVWRDISRRVGPKRGQTPWLLHAMTY
jgi:hypothetical protein